MNTSIHTRDCGWHVDQYSWECDCGAIKQAEREKHYQQLKLYSIKFTGYWPVGTAVVVQAISKEEALKLFQTYLLKHHSTLVTDNANLKEDAVDELDLTKNPVIILHDGQY